MKNLNFLLIFFLIISCSSTADVSNEITTTTIPSTSTSSTTSTIYVDPLIVNTYDELPDALVRIVVKSTQAEITEDFDIEIFEYEGTGSGFFISSDGYIVTNNHVVSGAVTIEVFTQYRSQPYSAKLIGLSECDDLAVLKIDIKDARYLLYENSDPQLGQDILAAGFPLGDKEVTFLNGIVSKKQANGSTSWASIEYAFEHTAEILPGSSGGPIVNENVRVLGIAYAGNEDRQEFGIPIVVVKDKIEEIINNNFQYSFKANLEQFYGVGLYVYSVDSDSPFRKVGITGGELITEIKGLSLVEENTLKVYCDALFARNPDIGINFSGVSIDKLEEFQVEVSLLGNVAEEILRKSMFADMETSPEDTKPSPSTTTTIALPAHNYTQEEIDFWYSTFNTDCCGGNSHQAEYFRWRKNEVSVSVEGSYWIGYWQDSANYTYDEIKNALENINNIQNEVTFTISKNNKDADIRIYIGPRENWNTFSTDCVQPESSGGRIQGNERLGSNYYDQFLIKNNINLNNEISNRVICIENGDLSLSRYSNENPLLNTGSANESQIGTRYFSRKSEEELYIGLMSSLVNSPSQNTNASYCFYPNQTKKDSNGDLYPYSKKPYQHISCGRSLYRSQHDFNDVNLSKLDIKLIQIHYDPILKNAKTIQEAYNILNS